MLAPASNDIKNHRPKLAQIGLAAYLLPQTLTVLYFRILGLQAQ